MLIDVMVKSKVGLILDFDFNIDTAQKISYMFFTYFLISVQLEWISQKKTPCNGKGETGCHKSINAVRSLLTLVITMKFSKKCLISLHSVLLFCSTCSNLVHFIWQVPSASCHCASRQYIALHSVRTKDKISLQQQQEIFGVRLLAITTVQKPK